MTGTGGSFTLYISLNDAGTSIPTPIVLPNSPFPECDYNNVISAAVNPNTVTVTAQKLNDNVKCIGATVPDNGAAQAFVLVGGLPNTVDYTFNWYNGAVGGTPSYTGATYSGLAAGTYNVTATYNATGCGSNVASVTIVRLDKAPLNVAIVVDKPNSSCVTPNGQVHAVVNGGDPVINYTFDWYEGNDIFTSPHIGTGSVATSLKGGKTYTVLVTDNASGCQAVASLAVPDATALPTVTASAVNAICVPANSGSVSANVGGITAGYTFDWYNGAATKPSSDFTGSTYSSIPVGSYTVVATENVSGCKSASATVQVNPPPPFTVTPSMVAQQTSCNPAAPNGSTTATVGGVTAGYTFKWFKGQSTAPANAIPGPTGLASGTYTVVATNNATGCTASDFTTVTQNLIYPVVTLTPAPNSVCNPALASSNYSGSVVATISYNGAPDGVAANYQFVWHQGPLATDPVIAGAATATINQLNGGNYTLVATRVGTSCAAPPSTALVNNTTVLPALSTSQTPSTNCTPVLANGIAEVTKVNGIAVGSTSNFSYQWFTGTGTGSAIAGATNAQLPDVQGGAGDNYTVQVTDMTTGCQNTSTVLVGDAKVLPNLSLAKVDNGICDPALTSPSISLGGSITATVTNLIGGLADYTFVFGGGAGSGTQLASPNQNQYTQLNGSGTNYTAVATQVSTGCVSATAKIKVKNLTTLPVITASAVPSTNCAGGAPNGQANVTNVDGAGTGAPYIFSWYDGNSVTPPVQSALKDYLNVQGGVGKNYTVQVTNQNTGCQNTKTVLVGDNSKIPTITVSEIDNTNCSATKNGTASLVTLTDANGGGSIASPFTGYSFSWNAGAFTTSSINNLSSGSYTLTVTNSTLNCTSSPGRSSCKR